MATAENHELLRRVLEQPDDDAPRLAYAEWCGAQDDESARARAEFIRGSLALARAGSDAERGLRARVQDLEQEHRSVWALPLAGLVDDVRFDRGFVELVGLPAPRFVDVADRILQLAPVRHLRLGAVREALGRLLTLPQLSAIRSLDLSGNALTDADIQTLARAPGLSGLRWLSLGYNDIGLDGVDALAASPHLRALRYVCLAGNLVDPSEKYSPEDHRIVDTWLPEEGVQLEQRHGRIPWLHVQAETVFEAIPDRFRIAV